MKDSKPAAGAGRMTVIDLAETAGIPVARARRMILTLGDDTKTLLRAINDQRSGLAKPPERSRA